MHVAATNPQVVRPEDIDQTVAALAVMAYSFVVTFIIAKVIDGTMGLRIDEAAERVGLDQSQHAESAYQA